MKISKKNTNIHGIKDGNVEKVQIFGMLVKQSMGPVKGDKIEIARNRFNKMRTLLTDRQLHMELRIMFSLCSSVEIETKYSQEYRIF